MFDRFAAHDPAQHLVFFELARLGDEDANRLADDFAGALAEQPLGGWIPGGDDAAQILADDGVVGRFDDRRSGPLERWRPGRAAVVRDLWRLFAAALARCRPVFGNQQTSFGLGQFEHVTHARSAEVDAVDALGQLLREPHLHGRNRFR